MTVFLIWFAISVDGRWISHVTTMSDIASCRALLPEQAISYCVESKN